MLSAELPGRYFPPLLASAGSSAETDARSRLTAYAFGAAGTRAECVPRFMLAPGWADNLAQMAAYVGFSNDPMFSRYFALGLAGAARSAPRLPACMHALDCLRPLTGVAGWRLACQHRRCHTGASHSARC